MITYMLISCYHASLYDRQSYNCRHMSRDLEDWIESFGFDVKIASNGRHMWIVVWGIHYDSVSLFPAWWDLDNVTYYDDFAQTIRQNRSE